MEIKGKIIQFLPAQSGTSKAGNEWSKQEFVIETDDQFPRKVCFTLFGDKLSLLNGISVGDEVDVSFNIESREYNGKWFHNINAWKINPAQPPQQSAQQGSPFQPDDVPLPPPEPERDGTNDDLPF
ncbi:MAG: DUF3127 domain-containing protein [Prolixibacteraceae bacterium]|nr:DUF3127 domain-containing protein [Prolixibacteraceae bacterium]